MSQDLHALEAWTVVLTERLAPAARRRLAREIATTLRTSPQQRIAAQPGRHALRTAQATAAE